MAPSSTITNPNNPGKVSPSLSISSTQRTPSSNQRLKPFLLHVTVFAASQAIGFDYLLHPNTTLGQLYSGLDARIPDVIMRPYDRYTTYPFELARRFSHAIIEVETFSDEGLCIDEPVMNLKNVGLTDDIWEIIDSWLSRDREEYCSTPRLLLGEPFPNNAVDEYGNCLAFRGVGGVRGRRSPLSTEAERNCRSVAGEEPCPTPLRQHINDAWEGEEGYEKPESPPSDWERAQDAADSA